LQFNNYIQTLKEDLLAGKLGGNRRDFWNRLKKEKIGLITNAESEVDQVEDVDEDKGKKVRDIKGKLTLVFRKLVKLLAMELIITHVKVVCRISWEMYAYIFNHYFYFSSLAMHNLDIQCLTSST
jgi:hypothetical protein